MKDSLILQDKIYISARRVHELFGYTSDYVGQLCRAGKLDAKMIGRAWFVTEKSVIDHLSTVGEIIKNKSKEKRRISKKIYKQKIAEKEDAVSVPMYASISNIPVEEIQSETQSEIQQVVPQEIQSIPVVASTQLEEEIMKVEDKLDPIALVPRSFSLPFYISKSFAFAPFESPRSRAVIIFTNLRNVSLGVAGFLITFVFIFQLIFPNNFSTRNIVRSISEINTTQMISSVEGVGGKISTFFSNVGKFARNSWGSIFERGKNEIVINEGVQVEEKIPFNGMAVVPSTNSKAQDELIKQKIKNSFSDEVLVRPDASGDSGIITPVFKKVEGDDFLYVLVPVNQ